MEPDDRLIAKKEGWARTGRGLTGEIQKEERPRLPPGQKLNKGFPVLDLGILPEVDIDVGSYRSKGRSKTRSSGIGTGSARWPPTGSSPTSIV